MTEANKCRFRFSPYQNSVENGQIKHQLLSIQGKSKCYIILNVQKRNIKNSSQITDTHLQVHPWQWCEFNQTNVLQRKMFKLKCPDINIKNKKEGNNIFSWQKQRNCIREESNTDKIKISLKLHNSKTSLGSFNEQMEDIGIEYIVIHS